MKIAEYLLQNLERIGVRAIFGNPGTTEIPLVRACDRREGLRYIVALSEAAAVPMADGYARATRSLGVVNLHVAPGLGNGMGGLYTAGIAKTPLLVLIGGQDSRLLHTAPILYGPLEAMASTVCKAVLGLHSTDDAAANIRNAIRAALTPPFRPVALICPPDLLEADIDVSPTTIAPVRLGGLEHTEASRIADLLCAARSPALIAAEDVHWHSAAPALRALAESLDAPVYAAPYCGVLPIDAASPAYGGYLSPGLKAIAERLSEHDALLFVGGRSLRTTLYSEASLPQPKAWIGDDPTVMPIGGEFTATHVVDLRQGLSAVRMACAGRWRREGSRPKQRRSAAQVPDAGSVSLHPTRAICALLQAFPEALLYDESGLSTSDVRQWMQAAAGDYIINGSGGIGWGLAAAVGGAIGRRERQVVAIMGDGSALYASEALWSASNQGTRMLVVVLVNRRYATLNEAAVKLTGRALDLFSIEPPQIDFSGLATLYGWDHARARSEEELGAALHAIGGRVARNTLLELVLDPAVTPVTAARHF